VLCNWSTIRSNDRTDAEAAIKLDGLFVYFVMTNTPLREAQRFMRLAYTSQMNGQLGEAIELYRKSISIYPTAEAHTFLGWTYSFQGNFDAAIDECMNAIELDPDFGNPYNDIGAYLIRQGKFREAIPWLQKACAAPRYDARHYPHYNLGRIYERLGRILDALDEYREAGRLEPEYKEALQAAERVQAFMN
jgi:tetratricopeptide (TPR) repeat protein